MAFKVLVGIAVVLAVLSLVIASRPAEFHIERSIVIAAPPEAAFSRVDDFHAWAAWSPYEKLDLQMKKTFEGASSGAGAVYSWAGTAKVGEGRMTIEKSQPPSSISIKLEFFKPFAATNVGAFTFVPEAGGTKVTWAMDGKNAFGAKAASLFMDMDKLVGTDFERGLAALKVLAESPAK